MSSTAEPCYKPLAKDRKQIRLLNISNDTGSGIRRLISCSLTVFSLDDAPAYTALSYEWGSQNDRRIICLNGFTTIVRHNLFDFLRQYCTVSEKGYLWIDALCINQDDLLERGHQVGFMADIYRQAERVIIWLGVEPSLVCAVSTVAALRSDTGASRLLQFSKRMFRLLNISYYLDGDRKEVFTAAEAEGDNFDKNIFTSWAEHDKILKNIEIVCRSTYWSRIWIVQEVLLAREAYIWCSDGVLELDVLRMYLAHITSIFYHNFLPTHRDDLYKRSVSGFRDTSGRRRRQRQNSGEFLYKCQARVLLVVIRYSVSLTGESSSRLFYMFEGAECSDVKDRIYTLLSLINRTELSTFPIVPDYTISVTELFVLLCSRAVRLLVKEYGSEFTRVPWTYAQTDIHSLRRRLESTEDDEVFKRVKRNLEYLNRITWISQ